MTSREDSPRDNNLAVLAVAAGLLLIATAWLTLFGARMSDLDGEALLAERFSRFEVPAGMAVVDALRLSQGEEVVVLSNPETWEERRLVEQGVWKEIDAKQSKAARSHGFDGGSRERGGGGRSGRRGPRGSGGHGSFGGAGAGFEQTDWQNIEEGAAGEPPWEVAFVWYPERGGEDVLARQFGRGRFGDLRELGPEGGKVTIASGPVAWRGYETHYAIERQFAKADEKKIFRDNLRINLTLGRPVCVFYARWPQGAPGSIESVSALLEAFVPISPE